jgi:U32 family peptidase
MINIITQISCKDQIKTLKDLGCRELTVTTPFLSFGIEHTFSIEALEPFFHVANENDVKLGVLINRLIMETEWHMFETEIEKIEDFDPAFYIVSDVGVLYYIKKYLNKPVYFHSDTTVANTHDAKVLLNHADKVMPARELTLVKKIDIINDSRSSIMIPVFGYQVISKSYRPLLTNYFNEINKTDSVKNKKYYFREEKRDNLYIGFEDEHGFTMFTDKVLDLFKEKSLLEESGLEFGWIDSNFIDQDILYDVIMYYHDMLTIDQLQEKMQEWKIKTDELLNYQDTVTIKEGSE